MPIYCAAPPPLRRRLEGLMQVFLAEKQFVGTHDLDVTDEMRIAIAAQACVLVLKRPGVPERGLYPELREILVYPAEFVVHESVEDEHGLVTEGSQVLSGQAWDSNRIILSWEDIEETSVDYNVVLHEFAHYLDMEDEAMNGAPALGDAQRYAAWSVAFQAEYDRLGADLDAGRETFLDPYAATDPAEFFAVVTEAYFGQSRELAVHHPALHALLADYYGFDPGEWPTASG